RRLEWGRYSTSVLPPLSPHMDLLRTYIRGPCSERLRVRPKSNFFLLSHYGCCSLFCSFLSLGYPLLVVLIVSEFI
uniref:Uncharacterized protein n=1 Tax=Amphimedon queenslandica TaxID=400682 RepID=A0A1X7U4S0_AMPQE